MTYILTINRGPRICSVLLTPINWLIGKTPKFPISPPIFKIDTTNDASSKFNGPVENVLFSLWSSLKFIVAHPDTIPNDNVSKLPISTKEEIFFYLTASINCLFQ